MHCHRLPLPPFRCPSSHHARSPNVGTLFPDSDHASDLLVASIAPVRYEGPCVAQEIVFLYNRHLRRLLAVGPRGSDRAGRRKGRLEERQQEWCQKMRIVASISEVSSFLHFIVLPGQSERLNESSEQTPCVQPVQPPRSGGKGGQSGWVCRHTDIDATATRYRLL